MKTLLKGLVATAALVGALVPAAPAAVAAGCTTTASIGSVSRHEGSDPLTPSPFTFTIGFTASSSTCATSGSVKWQTKDGSATVVGKDYRGASGEIVVSGQTSAIATVSVTGDSYAEADETFSVELVSTSTGLVVGRGTATGTVWDDDGGVWGPVTNDIQGGKVCWVPDGPCKVTVSISRVANHAVTLRYSTVDGTAKAGYDYVPVEKGVLTIPAGKNAAVISIDLLPDERGEDKEDFAIVISEPSAGTLGNEKAVVTVVP